MDWLTFKNMVCDPEFPEMLILGVCLGIQAVIISLSVVVTVGAFLGYIH